MFFEKKRKGVALIYPGEVFLFLILFTLIGVAPSCSFQTHLSGY